MKKKLLLLAMLALLNYTNAQQTTNGPEGNNDKDMKLNRMLEGDDNSFYTYRVRAKGKGTSYFVEKYDKSSLKPLFTKEINVEEDRYTKVEDVKFAGNNVFIFIRQYNKKEDKMTMNYFTVSSSGEATNKMNELFSVKSDHYEYVDFDIYATPSNTKFLFKTSFKANEKDTYKTHFTFYDAATMKKISEQTVRQMLFGPQERLNLVKDFSPADIDFTGLAVDDDNNIYYSYTYYSDNSTRQLVHYRTAVNILKPGDTEPTMVRMQFDNDYKISDVLIKKNTTANELDVAAYFNQMAERNGKLVETVGILSVRIDLEKKQIKSKNVKLFDDNLLKAIEAGTKNSEWFEYKMDYILPIGNATYYVGQQFLQKVEIEFDPDTHTSRGYWDYKYRDVLVAKLNENGKFEWITNMPLRINLTLEFGLVYKQYVATASEKSLYIFNDEVPKNMKKILKGNYSPDDLEPVTEFPGSSFVCSKINLTDGKAEHKLIFENEDFVFEPAMSNKINFMPTSKHEMFVRAKQNSIIVYTNNKGKDRFCNLKLD